MVGWRLHISKYFWFLFLQFFLCFSVAVLPAAFAEPTESTTSTRPFPDGYRTWIVDDQGKAIWDTKKWNDFLTGRGIDDSNRAEIIELLQKSDNATQQKTPNIAGKERNEIIKRLAYQSANSPASKGWPKSTPLLESAAQHLLNYLNSSNDLAIMKYRSDMSGSKEGKIAFLSNLGAVSQSESGKIVICLSGDGDIQVDVLESLKNQIAKHFQCDPDSIHFATNAWVGHLDDGEVTDILKPNGKPVVEGKKGRPTCCEAKLAEWAKRNGDKIVRWVLFQPGETSGLPHIWRDATTGRQRVAACASCQANQLKFAQYYGDEDPPAPQQCVNRQIPRLRGGYRGRFAEMCNSVNDNSFNSPLYKQAAVSSGNVGVVSVYVALMLWLPAELWKQEDLRLRENAIAATIEFFVWLKKTFPDFPDGVYDLMSRDYDSWLKRKGEEAVSHEIVPLETGVDAAKKLAAQLIKIRAYAAQSIDKQRLPMPSDIKELQDPSETVALRFVARVFLTTLFFAYREEECKFEPEWVWTEYSVDKRVGAHPICRSDLLPFMGSGPLLICRAAKDFYVPGIAGAWRALVNVQTDEVNRFTVPYNSVTFNNVNFWEQLGLPYPGNDKITWATLKKALLEPKLVAPLVIDEVELMKKRAEWGNRMNRCEARNKARKDAGVGPEPFNAARLVCKDTLFEKGCREAVDKFNNKWLTTMEVLMECEWDGYTWLMETLYSYQEVKEACATFPKYLTPFLKAASTRLFEETYDGIQNIVKNDPAIKKIPIDFIDGKRNDVTLQMTVAIKKYFGCSPSFNADETVTLPDDETPSAIDQLLCAEYLGFLEDARKLIVTKCDRVGRQALWDYQRLLDTVNLHCKKQADRVKYRFYKGEHNRLDRAWTEALNKEISLGGLRSGHFCDLLQRTKAKLSINVDGSGVLKTEEGEIACSDNCTYQLPVYSSSSLRPYAHTGYRFKNMSGDCDSNSPVRQCDLIMNEAKNVSVEFESLALPLKVRLAGLGTGTVTSDPPRIACVKEAPEKCVQTFNRASTVKLTAEAKDTNSEFARWSGGGCTGNSECILTNLQTEITVAAVFKDVTPNLRLTVANGLGGAITALHHNTSQTCKTSCWLSGAHRFATATLIADPSPGYRFKKFTGLEVCQGSASSQCLVTMDGEQSVTAHFETTTVPLTVRLSGSGKGKVTTQNLNAIACGNGAVASGTQCKADLTRDVQVTLLPQPENTDSKFTAWSGACTGNGDCTVTMTAAKTVTASFKDISPKLDVTIVGKGSVTIPTNAKTFTCPGTCKNIKGSLNMPITIIATPSVGARFKSWGGFCSGSAALVCTVPMNESKTFSTTANFASGQSSPDIDPPPPIVNPPPPNPLNP